MASTQQILMKMRTDKKKLLMLAKKKRLAVMKEEAARKELKSLRKDISNLKIETGKDVGSFLKRKVGMAIRTAKSEETRSKAKKSGKKISSAFNSFRDFATKVDKGF